MMSSSAWLVFPPCLVLALAATVAAPAAEPDWGCVYPGRELPEACGWGVSPGANTTAEVTEAGLRVVDAGTVQGELRCYSQSWPVVPERGGVVRATVRVVACSGPSGVCLMAADGVHEAGLTVYPDRLELPEPAFRHAMDTTDRLHEYELAVRGTDLVVRVDGQVVLDGRGQFTRAAHQGRRVVMFGSISSAATSEAVWREVRHAADLPPVVRVAGAQDVIVFRKEGVYACFPSLLRLPDGRLFTSFGTRSRRSHIDPTGGSARLCSRDGGLTWEAVTAWPVDPRLVREDGTTFVPHAQGWLYVDEAELPRVKAMGRTWRQVKPGQIAYLGDPRVSITAPGGAKRVVELANPAPAGVMAFHRESAFLRAGPVWIEAVYGPQVPDGPDGVYGIRSGDNGETWSVVPIAVPAAGQAGYNETALCDNGRGQVVALLRPHDERQNTYQCESADGGQTWGPVRDTGVWGYPAHLLRLSDGRLLWTRGYRRENMGVRALLSRDGGRTWDTEHELVLRGDGRGSGSDNGYPVSVQTDDTHVFTIYYLNDRENVTHVAGTLWPLPAVAGP